jgi:hypothetical protein
MPYATGHLAQNPVPPGIVGALSLGGYQLLVDVAGIGAGRLGQQAFLLAVAEPDGAGQADPGTQVSLHQGRLRDEAEMAAITQLAAQLGFLRISGYRVSLERNGLRSKLSLVNPATGAIVLQVPERYPGKLFGGGVSASSLLAAARSLPPAGPPPDLRSPDALRQLLLAMALADDSLGGAEAVEVADRALAIASADSTLDPTRALAAARDQR